MTIFYLFLDGVGLGLNEPAINPFAAQTLPTLQGILGGVGMFQMENSIETERASLFPLDASLGVDGFPQSATGQAVLLTGINIPQAIGYHYGPKPDAKTASFLINGGLFGDLIASGKKVSFINAYPQQYFDTIESGKHLYSSFPLAATNSGISLLTTQHLVDGSAMSADITGMGWKEFFKIEDLPIKTPFGAGAEMAQRWREEELVFFEYWLTDYAGHRQDMGEAKKILLEIDQMIDGIAQTMGESDLILVTSDHGNIEDLATRRHTMNKVPLLLIGNRKSRKSFHGAKSIMDVAPGIKKMLGVD